MPDVTTPPPVPDLDTDTDAAVASCLELIRRQRYGVSVAELATTCEFIGIDVEGDVTLWATGIRNLLLWANTTDEFVAIVSALHAHPGVVLIACRTATFDADKGTWPEAVARLPRANWPPHPGGYPSPRFLAVSFVWRRPLAGAPRTITPRKETDDRPRA